MKRIVLTVCSTTVLTIGIVSFFGFAPNNEPTDILQSNEIPVGTIMAWAGDPAFLPNNWKVCDGLTLAKDRYSDLYRVVADNWTPDRGVNQDLFKIPDLRGVFLRGVTGSRNDEFADPEKDNRSILGIGNGASNGVGSFQKSSTKVPNANFTGNTGEAGSHTHELQAHGGGKGVEHGTGTRSIVTYGDNVHGSSAISLSTGNHGHSVTVTGGGDVETRPTNAYIHWIIKVQ